METERCVNCGEPLYIRRGHDIRVFHAQFPDNRKTEKGRRCDKPEWSERFK